jgi:hypothetical protein
MRNAGSLRQWGACVLPVVASISVVLGVAFDLHERFLTPEIQQTTNKYLNFDAQMASATRGDGLFLHFAGFPMPMAWLGLDFYSRAVYSGYPRLVLVADPATPIFSSGQLQAANFDPDSVWLLNHGTPVEVTYAFDAGNGNISVTVQRVNVGPAPSR